MSHVYNLSSSYCRELFGTMEDIKIHQVFDPQCSQGYHVSKLIARQTRILESGIYHSMNLALPTTLPCETLSNSSQFFSYMGGSAPPCPRFRRGLRSHTAHRGLRPQALDEWQSIQVNWFSCITG